MTLHLVKLCVGIDSVDHLRRRQSDRLKAMKLAGETPLLIHRTFQMPKRRDELLEGGSLYWVIKGVIQARQPLMDLSEGRKDNGSRCCVISLKRTITLVRPHPRRAFQGWRYLYADDAPADLSTSDKLLADLPPAMRRELSELGLI
jgi:hypothetical protein